MNSGAEDSAQILHRAERALAEQDWGGFGEVMDDHFFALLLGGAPVAELLEAVPVDWLRANPRHLMTREISRRWGRTGALIDTAVVRRFSAWVEAQDPPATRDVLGVRLNGIEYLLAAGRFTEAERSADEVMRVVRSAPDLRELLDVLPVALIRVGTVYLLAGRMKGAIAAFAEAERWSGTPATHPAGPLASAHQALAHALRGDIGAAERAVARSRSGRTARERSAPGAAVGAAAVSLIALGKLARAEAFAAAGELERADTAGSGELWWMVHHVRARLSLAWGDTETAAYVLERVVEERADLTVDGSLAGELLRADLADLFQAGGRLAAAAAVISGRERRIGTPTPITSNLRLALLRGEPDAVLEGVAAVSRDRAPAAEWLVLRANALHALGDDEGASLAVLDAAGVMRRMETLSPYLEAAPAIATQLADELGLVTAPAGRPFTRQVTTPRLTPREREVLAGLAEFESIRRLAAELFLSSNTVKTHLRSLYRKLGAGSRPEALRIARQLGLIPASGSVDRGEGRVISG